MPEQKIDTGIPRLDEDLHAFFQTCEPASLARIEEATRGDDQTKFEDLVPENVLRLAAILADPDEYQALSSKIPEDARSPLNKAEALARKQFKSILEHPLARNRIDAMVEQRRDIDALADSLKTITGIESQSAWVGKPPRLHPSVRIGFNDQRGRALLDSTLSWDDLLFLVKALAGIAVDQLQDGQELANLQQIYAGDVKKLAMHIRSIDERVSEIKRLAPIYGIEVDETSKDGCTDDEHSG